VGDASDSSVPKYMAWSAAGVIWLPDRDQPGNDEKGVVNSDRNPREMLAMAKRSVEMRAMHCVAPEDLDAYLQADRIGSLLRAWERAGDHAKNLAEEVCHFVRGHTVRHVLMTYDKPIEQMFLDWLRDREPQH